MWGEDEEFVLYWNLYSSLCFVIIFVFICLGLCIRFFLLFLFFPAWSSVFLSLCGLFIFIADMMGPGFRVLCYRTELTIGQNHPEWVHPPRGIFGQTAEPTPFCFGIFFEDVCELAGDTKRMFKTSELLSVSELCRRERKGGIFKVSVNCERERICIV